MTRPPRHRPSRGPHGRDQRLADAAAERYDKQVIARFCGDLLAAISGDPDPAAATIRAMLTDPSGRGMAEFLVLVVKQRAAAAGVPAGSLLPLADTLAGIAAEMGLPDPRQPGPHG